ncbi:MAG TPA: NADH-quinone oxidoreductase subunit M, partial [Chitinophaga sp.]
AVYTLNMLQKVIFGQSNTLTSTVTDLQNTELVALSLIVVVILFLGFYPKPMLELVNSTSQMLLANIVK